MKWLLKRREVIAWVLLLVTCATCIFTLIQSRQESRKETMELNDMLQTRLYQMVNDTATVQSGAGTGGTASVNGNDAIGQINITTGSNPTAGSLVHISFAKPYGTQPIVVVSPLDQSPPPNWYVTIDQNGFDIVVGSAPKADTNYPFAYFIAPRPWLMYLNDENNNS